jgi:hypothetical protein
VRKLDSTDNWVRLNAVPATAEALIKDIAHARHLTPGTDLIQSIPFLVRGPAAVFEPTTATPIGELLKRRGARVTAVVEDVHEVIELRY